MSHGGSRRRRGERKRMAGEELFGSSTVRADSSGGVTVGAGIIVVAAIMGEIIAAGFSTIPVREVVRRRVTFTSRIDHRSEITTSSSNSRITVVDGRETPEEEEDSGTGAEEGRMESSSRSRDRWRTAGSMSTSRWRR